MPQVHFPYEIRPYLFCAELSDNTEITARTYEQCLAMSLKSHHTFIDEWLASSLVTWHMALKYSQKTANKMLDEIDAVIGYRYKLSGEQQKVLKEIKQELLDKAQNRFSRNIVGIDVSV